jgi:hypothetical protein
MRHPVFDQVDTAAVRTPTGGKVNVTCSGTRQ